jgi:hypothetical protein
MQLVEMTDDERTALDNAQRAVRRVREWRRYQAVRLLAEGREASEVAQVLGCRVSRVSSWGVLLGCPPGVSSWGVLLGCPPGVSSWAADWREKQVAGLAEGPHEGRARRLDAGGWMRAAKRRSSAGWPPIRKRTAPRRPTGPCRSCGRMLRTDVADGCCGRMLRTDVADGCCGRSWPSRGTCCVSGRCAWGSAPRGASAGLPRRSAPRTCSDGLIPPTRPKGGADRARERDGGGGWGSLVR